MNDCIRNKAGILIGLFTLLGCFAVRAQDIFGGHLFYGQYNVSNIRYWGLGDFRRQGNLAGFGFSYGYQWILSPHWSIEGTLGIGYAHLHYSKYPCKECGKRLSVNNRNYLGPTRAAVSIIYLLK